MSEEITFTSEIATELDEAIGDDAGICRAARVSTIGAEAASTEADAGLIRFLMKHRHGSPFEQGWAKFRLHAPIFVMRELMRHRWTSFTDESAGLSFNEESGRYRELRPVFWVPRADRPMVPVEGFKPARPEFKAGDEAEVLIAQGSLKESYRAAWRAYQGMLVSGIAREVARAVLPVGIYSSCYFSGNVRALLAFLSLRTSNQEAAYRSFPQAEIEECARFVESVLKERWPLTMAAFEENGRVAP